MDESEDILNGTKYLDCFFSKETKIQIKLDTLMMAIYLMSIMVVPWQALNFYMEEIAYHGRLKHTPVTDKLYRPFQNCCVILITWKILMELVPSNHLQLSIVIYKDNAACVTCMKTWYMKSNITTHIIHKLFYPYITP